MQIFRLDKILATQSTDSRKDVKQLIKKGVVTINGVVAKSGKEKVDIDVDIVKISGEIIMLKKHIYIMMNKPKGVVSATEDEKFSTVIDILPEKLKRKGLFPAGRLDKDTTGFMLITDDGEFAHNMLSPRHHVDKTYTAVLDKYPEKEIEAEFLKGVKIGADEICKPAKLIFLDKIIPKVQVVISEGMYHQIKRMFAVYGYTVVELKREKIGKLALDSKLAEGDSREITDAELALIFNK